MYNLEEFEKNMELFKENVELYNKLIKDYNEEEEREEGIDTMIYVKAPEKSRIYVGAPEKPRYSFNGIAIKDIDVVVPDKVVIVTIVDYCFGFGFNPNGYRYKMTCQEGDEFSLEKAVYIAIAKRLFSDYYTFAGVIKKAEEELPYIKGFEKMVRYAVADYKKKVAEEERKEKEETERKAIAERRRAKKERKRAKREAREKEAFEELLDILVDKLASKLGNNTDTNEETEDSE